MDTDLMFVIGAVVFALSIPSIISAFADGRPPRVAAIALLVGGVLVVMALRRMPGGLEIADVPHIFLRVIGRLLN
jgi:hypothetical protein